MYITVVVRYLYLLDRSLYAVMYESKTKMLQGLLYRKKPGLTSSVIPAECYVCGKGLEDGHSIIAKSLRNGVVMFCDVHNSLQ